MQTSSWKLSRCVLALVWPVLGMTQEHNPVAREPATAAISVAASVNVIVKLRSVGSGGTHAKLSPEQTNAVIASRTALKLTLRREISD